MSFINKELDLFESLRTRGVQVQELPASLQFDRPLTLLPSGFVGFAEQDNAVSDASVRAAQWKEGALPHPFVCIGHSGHGFGSWYLQYQVATTDYALFLSLAWGGIQSSDESSLSRVNAQLQLAAEFVRAAEEKRVSGKWLSGKRLLVLESDAFASQTGWGWVDATGDAPEWQSLSGGSMFATAALAE